MKKFVVSVLSFSLAVVLILQTAFVGEAATASTATEQDDGVVLTSLMAEDISLTNGLNEEFSPDITNYTMTVHSDIYGVRVTAEVPDGVSLSINGITATSGEGTIVHLSEDYEDYDIDYTQEIKITAYKAEKAKTYTITVNRPSSNNIYQLFKENSYKDAENGVTLPYLTYVPSDYDATKQYPLVFFLHGSGQRTQSLDMVLKRGGACVPFASDSEAGKNECIILAPQCSIPEGSKENWTTLMQYRAGTADNPFDSSRYLKAAYNLLQDFIGQYSIDTNRIYMTGLSAGGFGTYTLAIEHPETFAAIVPVCGGVDTTKVEALKGMPIWIFQSADDPSVPIDTYLCPDLQALNNAGIEYKLTLYPNGAVFCPSGHFSWTPAYYSEDMKNWLFSQTKQ